MLAAAVRLEFASARAAGTSRDRCVGADGDSTGLKTNPVQSLIDGVEVSRLIAPLLECCSCCS
ncbi:hypothetical protein BKA81DRAFT_354130 [Phyllosticta paracitricarpa]